MKRIEKIHQYLVERTKEITAENLLEKKGITTSEIADQLDILRNNVSLELNKLLRQQKIIKVTGRPVYYLDREHLEEILQIQLPEHQDEYSSLDDIIAIRPVALPVDPARNLTEALNPFDELIGSKTSLRNQVEQAKAVILYPPHGLHTLIVGPTGVGKTLLANMMHKYAVNIGKYSEDTPFVVFNCADYYNNPQLLLSQIFGHKKGAFTGATSDKEGLFAKADGGILFLDEIHRLPPEGQEMIFYFMDTGTYGRLGESDRSQRANVLIISATTENPESSLLQTFVRRIPIVISIPSFDEWQAKDKVNMLKSLLSKEADRVQKPIKIDAESMKALIGNTTYGNIGQLKSNVQLICANGFLRCLNEDTITIHFKDLPPEVKDGFFNLNRRRTEFQKISDHLDASVTILPVGDHKVLFKEDPYEPNFNLYSIIEDKVMFMVDQGIPEDDINRFLTIDIDIHLNKFYNKFKNNGNNKDKILKIVNEDILEFSEEMKTLVERDMGRKLTDRFLLAFSLHLTSFLKRIENQHKIQYTNIEHVIHDMPKEYSLALKICEEITNTFHVTVPRMEAMYLTVLINSILNDERKEQVSILVATHGNSTASSMVNVVKHLLGESNLYHIDMPLDMSPKKVLAKMREVIREIEMGKGVLLLVDMGSLTGFGSVVMEETGIPVRTIDMVSTPTVLEAVRKASILEMDLDEIYTHLKEFKGYGGYEAFEEPAKENVPAEKPVTILTVCSTGEGTAQKMKDFIRSMLDSHLGENDINILPVPVNKLDDVYMEKILAEYDVILTVGIANPGIGVPFIPLESLLMDSDENRLIHLIQNRQLLSAPKKPHAMVLEMSEKSLNEFLTFLNPKKVTGLIHRFVEKLEGITERAFSNSSKISLIVHIGCALERTVINDPLTYGNVSKENKKWLPDFREAANMFDETLKIKLADEELYHLIDIIQDSLNRE
ncbi:MAG: sigma-54-dependent transcriptional regulator [Bacillus sp. (in: firmicutes)]